MTALVPPSLVWPLLAACVLAALPPRPNSRLAPMLAATAALGTLLLTLSAVLSSPLASSAVWLQDRLARSMPVPLAIPALLDACGALLPGRPSDARGLRRRLVAAQLLTAGAIAACRADPLFAMLAGFALLAAGGVLLLPGRDRARMLAWMVASLLVAWTGAALLSCDLAAPASWTGLAAVGHPPALRLPGLLLLLLPMLLLAWLSGWPGEAASGAAPPGQGAPEPGAPKPGEPASLLLPLLALPALVAALRLRGLPAQDPVVPQAAMSALVGGGLLMLLLSVLLLSDRQGRDRRPARVATIQLGAAAIGFGVGGTSGVVAGLLLLAFLAIALPASLLPAATRGGRAVRRMTMLSLAGLPPFGPFAASFMLLLRLCADRLLLALLVLAAMGAGAASLLSARRSETETEPGPATRPAPVPDLVPGLVALALLGWLGLAMPAGLSDWLLGIAESMAGTTAASP